MSEKLLFRYYLRLKTEGFLKALLWGLAIGFSALAVFGVLHWVMDWKFAWACVLVWAVCSTVPTLAFYHWKYKPTTKYIARRVDDLGLHERILTMTELEGDDSYIARRQREDALESLSMIREDLLTIGVSVPSVVTASAAMVLGVLGCLCASGTFKSFADINPVVPTTYEITYAVQNERGGKIVGELKQTVALGEKTEGVVAVPDDGWRFLKWTDNSGRPYRSDEVSANKTYLAVFVEMDFGEMNGLMDDMPPDAPGNGEEENQQSSQNQNQNQNQQAQDKTEEVNQIIDGNTYYGDVYDEEYREALEKLMDEKYTGDQKEIAGGYFENIEKGNNESDDNEENN